MVEYTLKGKKINQPEVLAISTPTLSALSCDSLAAIRILGDRPETQYWAVAPSEPEKPKCACCGSNKGVKRVSLNAMTVSTPKNLGARRRKKLPRVEYRGGDCLPKINTLSLAETTVNRINAAVESYKAEMETKRARFVARYKVPTKRKRHG